MSSAMVIPTVSTVAPPPPAPVSFEEFLARADERRAEWVDGVIVPTSPNSIEHQRLLKFLAWLLDGFARTHGLGEVLFAPVIMRLASRPSGREPDLLFVATEHRDRLTATYLDGPADLVVEIVSPESDARDRGDKFVEYEAGGIPEYWLIDPVRKDAVFYHRDAAGHYQRGSVETDGTYRSVLLPGFRLRVEWLWQQPLPDPATVGREPGL